MPPARLRASAERPVSGRHRTVRSQLLPGLAGARRPAVALGVDLLDLAERATSSAELARRRLPWGPARVACAHRTPLPADRLDPEASRRCLHDNGSPPPGRVEFLAKYMLASFKIAFARRTPHSPCVAASLLPLLASSTDHCRRPYQPPPAAPTPAAPPDTPRDRAPPAGSARPDSKRQPHRPLTQLQRILAWTTHLAQLPSLGSP